MAHLCGGGCLYLYVRIPDILVLIRLVVTAVRPWFLPDTLVLYVVNVPGGGSVRGWLGPPGVSGQSTLCRAVVILSAGTGELRLYQTELLAVQPARHPLHHPVVVALQEEPN